MMSVYETLLISPYYISCVIHTTISQHYMYR